MITRRLIVAVAILLAQEVYCQCLDHDLQLPNIGNALLKGAVTKDSATGVFSYRYAVTNVQSNTGCIKWLEIDLIYPQNAANLSQIGLIDYPDYVDRAALSMAGTPRVIPVGIPRLPSYKGFTSAWDADFTVRGSITWSCAIEEYRVEPGARLDSIIITSYGLPALRNSIIYPSYNPPPIDTVESTEQESLAFDSLEASLRWNGFTVGPTAPLANFSPQAFLDTLNSFVSQSRSLGWITTQTIADKYTGYFNRIKNDVSIFSLKTARTRIDTVLQQVNIDSSSTLTSEAYALIRFNTEYLRDQLKPTNQVKAGIFNPTGGTISVKAKPSVAFGSGDALKCMEATIRWLTSYNITLGTVSSPVYGFAKDGSVTNVGSYSYQKFKTTSSQTLNWSAGSEYELFTVPVSGYYGLENFELTNALSGGEWFVDINYLDKTDSTFYQGTATGFINLNKSLSNSASWYNGQRHILQAGTKLHEVFTSQGEIYYRRSSDVGSTWDVTARISTGNGNNTAPSIAPGSSSKLYLVWQRANGSNDTLYFAKSTNNGTSWGSATSIVTGISTSSSQEGSIYPVVAEWNGSKIVTVYCTSNGLASRVSTNGGSTWSSSGFNPGGGGDEAYVQYLSLSSIGSYLMLTYDTRYWGVRSRLYDAQGWGDETYASSGTGTIYDRYSSVAGDDQDNPIAAWCAQKSGESEYRLVFRQGYSDNTWDWFVELPKTTGVSDYSPSITYLSGFFDILYHRSNSELKIKSYEIEADKWRTYLWSSSGQWANISLETASSSSAVGMWTDQSGPPYGVQLRSTSGGGALGAPGGMTTTEEHHRRVVLESTADHSRLSYEVSPLRVVATAKDTVILPFKSHAMKQRTGATLDNVWDYLGTEQYTIPANARTLVVDVAIGAEAAPDTSGRPGVNSFTTRSFRIDALKGTQTIQLLSDQAGTSGRKQVDISILAGQAVVIRPVGIIPSSLAQKVSIGVGDVYVGRSK